MQKLILRRQSGYPVEADKKKEFQDIYREKYDQVHLEWHSKQITIEEYSAKIESLYSELCGQFELTLEVDFGGPLMELEQLISRFEAPILMVMNAATNKLEGIIMDSNDY